MYHIQTINKGFWRIFFPLLVIFYIFIAYNLVDIYFAGFVGDKAIAGLQLAFPIFFLLIALNEGIGTAANNLVSISLGERQKQKISKYFTIGFLISAGLGAIFFVFAPWIVKLFLIFFKSTDSQVLVWAEQYWVILARFAFFSLLNWMIWQFLIVFGKRKAQIWLALAVLFLNIILDRLFVQIFDRGVAGIAYATILVWIFVSVFGLYYIVRRKKLARFDFNLRLQDFLIFAQYASSQFIILFIIMGVIMIDNYFFSKVGYEALSAYGIGMRLKDVLFYPILGFSIAFAVLYWFFYGEKNIEAMDKTLRYAILIGVKYSLILLVLMPLIGLVFGRYFTDNSIIQKYILRYTSLVSLSMFWLVFEMIYSSAFQVLAYHKARIGLNILYLILVFVMEYVFYSLSKSFVSVMMWAVVASLITSLFFWAYYNFGVKKAVHLK